MLFLKLNLTSIRTLEKDNLSSVAQECQVLAHHVSLRRFQFDELNREVDEDVYTGGELSIPLGTTAENLVGNDEITVLELVEISREHQASWDREAILPYLHALAHRRLQWDRRARVPIAQKRLTSSG
jgi:hypothetical protein